MWRRPGISEGEARDKRSGGLLSAERGLVKRRWSFHPLDARAAGLNKALIYRAFSSKDEIFALTATSYLDDLRALTDQAELIEDGPQRLREVLTVFADFCVDYPAFLDCGLSLLRRPAHRWPP